MFAVAGEIIGLGGVLINVEKASFVATVLPPEVPEEFLLVVAPVDVELEEVAVVVPGDEVFVRNCGAVGE